MAKKPEEIKPGLPAWQGTFGDLMNLLLCFFVLLFSMATMDAQKFEEVAASFSSAFGIFQGGEAALGQGALVGDGISQLNQLSNYIISMGVSQSGSQDEDITDSEGENASESGGAGINTEGDTSGIMQGTGGEGNGSEGDATGTGSEGDSTEMSTESDATQQGANSEETQEAAEAEQLKASETLAAEVNEALDTLDVAKQVDVNFTSQFVQLTLQGAILFDTGNAVLKPGADSILNKVGSVLERYAGGTIEIEGHTDNVPMHRSSGKITNNDELSDARALSVFYYFIENTNLDPSKLKHSGRGEYEPVADNSTPEGRARNRRVEIRIYNPLSPMY
ncbi:flagellar motor protein MotB [Butyrivibrio sp. INlla16]|uniref:OmpA/MotB family protein n=1 Tax=Butyrivibrio sp. INlla16 TaxID=1520807 RepID=UPI00088CA33F|nr:flagellar motor protein MotB [Butyrivibrio sp. INlla16]SDB39426.1 chemotaxis protein MotB [Butyrivibrio sp. INlla16]